MTEFLIEYDCTECKGDIPFIVGLSKTWCCEVCGGTGTLIVTEEYETTEDAIEDYPKYVSIIPNPIKKNMKWYTYNNRIFSKYRETTEKMSIHNPPLEIAVAVVTTAPKKAQKIAGKEGNEKSS